MLRKIRSASLLLGVAATAGCVSVSTPDAPGPAPSASVSAPEPRTDGGADREIRQTPGGEALHRTGRSPRPESSARPAASPPPARRTSAPGAQAPAPAPAPRKPAPRAVAKPPRPAPKGPAQTDVCSMGRQYGGWDPDSPQSAICRGVYGH